MSSDPVLFGAQNHHILHHRPRSVDVTTHESERHWRDGPLKCMHSVQGTVAKNSTHS